MVTATLGQVEPFDLQTDDWEEYTERLEQFFVANGITVDAKKVAVFLTVVGGKAYTLLRNLLAPIKPATKSYSELVKVMKDHLKPKPLIIAERFKFHRRNQREGEQVAQYLAELRRLTEQCDFKDYLEEALRDRFVCGLRSEVIQRRLLAEEELTLKKAYEIAHGMETASRQASELQASTKSIPVPVKDVQRVVQQKPHSGGTFPPCYRCGKTGHSPDRCYFKTQQCRSCGKRGHIAKVCKASEKPEKGVALETQKWKPRPFPKRQQAGHRAGYVGCDPCEVPDSLDILEDSRDLFAVKVAEGAAESAIMLEPEVDDVTLPMELDTGASVSLISQKVWKEYLPKAELQKSDTLLKTYTGEKLHVLGELQVLVKYNGQEQQLPLLVVAERGPSLWGRNWLAAIQLNWAHIKQVRTELDTLLETYSEVFRKELGTLQGIEVKLVVKENATPKFFKPRSVPYAIRGAIEKDLERLENLGVIEKINYSDWAAPIVAVPKADGGIRICGDYKVTVNPVLQVDQYPVPRVEDLFATLAGGQKFSKLDLSQAYQQVLLEPASRKYVTVNTHRGLYQYNRLPFGVASAPAVFQQTMEKILQGLPRVVVYIDDILVTGRNDEEHLQTLEQVLARLQKYGLRLKREKCSFLTPSVEYLGYLVDKEGLHATAAKVEAVTQAPEPRNVQELRSFLGLVNYYAKFIHHLSTITQPLNHLLCQKVPWKWTKECQRAFLELKEQLASSEVLVHYDPQLPLKLDCDASAYGVGAVLSHVFPDGGERPVAYASRTLTQSEKGYAQLEKEALSLVFGIKKFHQFLYGRRFTLVTDHKPLLTILGPKRGLPTLAAARLQRWALLLAAYQYDIEFRSTTEHSNADGFSRLPLKVGEESECVSAISVFTLSQIEFLPVDTDKLRRATKSDPVLSRVMTYTQRGWPAHVEAELKPYANRRQELTTEAGCLLWGMRVIVPEPCRRAVLIELHTSHPGMVRMKSLARLHIWWPSIDKDIEQMVRECLSCQRVRNNPPTTLLHPWSWPEGPWKRIHVDFAGPFYGSMYMVVVDAHSKWLEVFPMSTTTTEKTLEVLRNLFASYGLPEQLVSDNGPQFTSHEFELCMKANGIKHIKTSPYHPASNGEAERFVQTFKQAMRAGKSDTGSLNVKLARFLLTYRSTPSTTTGVTPAELFLKRPLRTRLDLLRPSLQSRVETKQANQKRLHDAHSKFRLFEVGQSVLVRNLREGPKWLTGTVLEQTGPVSYRVQVSDQIWRRHTDQLLDHSVAVEDRSPDVAVQRGNLEILPSLPEPVPVETSEPEMLPEQSDSQEHTETEFDSNTSDSTIVSTRYPSRERQPPDRLSHKF